MAPTSEMEILHNPSDTEPVEDWFRSIGIVTKNEAAWMKFYYSILGIAAATSVQLLRKMREPDIDLALANCELSNGYKHALCEFLVPRGKKPFAFCSPALAKPEGSKRMYLKKFNSQKARQSLGNELGVEELAKVRFPDNLFRGIVCGKEVPMNGRGKHGTSAVANRVWSWAVARWGNLHVDQMFCDRMEELLSEKWPILKEWGGKPRDWSTIMKHRFSNAREANDGAYQSSAIPSVDMSSPAKRLLEDGLNLRVDDDAPSMYLGSLDDPGLGEEGSAAGTALGVPVRRSAGEGTGAGGVHVARGVAVPAAQFQPSSAGSASAGYGAIAPDSSDDEERPISSRRPPPATTATRAQAPDSSDDEEPLISSLRPPPAATARTSTPAPAPVVPKAKARPPPAQRPIKKRRSVAPASPFTSSPLATHWAALSAEEAALVGNDVKDPAGLGDSSLRVAKLFPLQDGTHAWFLATINTKFRLKHFFWVCFVEDESEYRIKFYPYRYKTEWVLVRSKISPAADEPAADEPDADEPAVHEPVADEPAEDEQHMELEASDAPLSMDSTA